MDDTDIIALCLMDDVESVVSNLLESLLETNTKTELDLGLLDVSHREQIVRDENYYKVTISRFNDSSFKNHYRMSRNTFEELESIIGNEIYAEPKSCRDLRKKLMFSLWILTKRESFQAAGERFGFAKSSGHTVFQDIVTVIGRLLPRYIKWHSNTRSQNEAVIFQRRSGGFPGVIGVVGACYIPIKGFNNDFYNDKKKTFSVILQGICDHKARFMDVFSGMPGKMDKVSVFRESDFYTKLSNTTVPLVASNMHILGDTSYPLMQNLMIPFINDGQLTKKQMNYNNKLNKIRTIIDRAFNVLISTFKRLEYLDCSTIAMANKMIVTACVLQNFLIDRNEIDVHYENYEDVIGDEDVENDECFNYEICEFQEYLSAVTKRKAIVELLL